MSGPVKESGYSLGTGLLAYIWTCTAISGLVIALRLFAVGYVLKRVRAADYTMVAAFMFMVAGGALVSRSIYWGVGRHIYHISQEQFQNAKKYITLATPPVVVTVALGRASFCLFLISAVGTERNVRVILWITLILQALFGVVQIILQFSSCGVHITGLWDSTIHAKCIPHTRIIDYIYFVNAWNTLTDLFLTTLPTYLLVNIKMERKKKIVALVLLCLSGLAFVISLTKIIATKELNTKDLSYEWARVNFRVMGEAYIIMIVASIPPMNCLTRLGNQKIHRGPGNSDSSKNQVTIKQSWTVEHEDRTEDEVLDLQ